MSLIPPPLPRSFTLLAEVHPDLPRTFALALATSQTLGPVEALTSGYGLDEAAAKALLGEWSRVMQDEVCPCRFLLATGVTAAELCTHLLRIEAEAAPVFAEVQVWFADPARTETEVRGVLALESVRSTPRGRVLEALSPAPPILRRQWELLDRIGALADLIKTTVLAPSRARL